MAKIILKDKTELEVKDMYSMGAVRVQLKNVSEVEALKEKLTVQNISHVEATNDGDVVIGVYEDLVLDEIWRLRWNEEGVEAEFSLREKTEAEKSLERIASLEDAVDVLTMEALGG